jgi:hypothetical protein
VCHKAPSSGVGRLLDRLDRPSLQTAVSLRVRLTSHIDNG